MGSALILGEQTGRVVYHAWTAMKAQDSREHVRDVQGRGFEYFFEPHPSLQAATPELIPEVDVCFSEWLPGDHWYGFQSSGQSLWKISPARNRFNGRTPTTAAAVANSSARVVMVETSRALFPEGQESVADRRMARARRLSGAYRSFTPREGFLRIVDELPHADIGIAIRHGDLQRYFPRSRQDLNVVVRWVLKLAAEYRVMLFSDNAQLRAKIEAHARRSGVPLLPRERLESGNPDRTDLAFREFLFLARKCRLVCGTPHSSFPLQAALFGARNYCENTTPPDRVHELLGL